MRAVEIFDLFSDEYQSGVAFLGSYHMPFISTRMSNTIDNQRQQIEIRIASFEKLAKLLEFDIDLEGVTDALPMEPHSYVPSVAHDFWHILDYQLGKHGYFSEMPESSQQGNLELAMTKIKDKFRRVSRSPEEFELHLKKLIEQATQELSDDLTYMVYNYREKRPEIVLLEEKILKVVNTIMEKKVLTEEFKNSIEARVDIQYRRFRYLKRKKDLYHRIKHNVGRLMYLQTIFNDKDTYYKEDRGKDEFTGFYKKSIEADKTNSSLYWSSGREITARGFEYYISSFYGKRANRTFLSLNHDVVYRDMYPSCNTYILKAYSQFFNILRKRGV